LSYSREEEESRWKSLRKRDKERRESQLDAEEGRATKIEALVARRQAGLTVVLEHTFDEYNAAAVMRSCDAFGVTELIMVNPHGEFNPLSNAFAKSSASSNKWVCCRAMDSTEECVELLKAEGFLNIATVCSDTSHPLFHAPELTAPKVAIWLGNEHSGLSEQAMELADAHLHIPMRGTESIEV
jgi:tRNA (guanosine-2'-O-)-methyltransferase